VLLAGFAGYWLEDSLLARFARGRICNVDRLGEYADLANPVTLTSNSWDFSGNANCISWDTCALGLIVNFEPGSWRMAFAVECLY
jgi:hypothetical protein